MKGEEDLDMEQIKGTHEGVAVLSWEKFTIAMAYMAELQIYKKPRKFDDFVVVSMRDKMVDIFVQLLRFR